MPDRDSELKALASAIGGVSPPPDEPPAGAPESGPPPASPAPKEGEGGAAAAKETPAGAPSEDGKTAPVKPQLEDLLKDPELGPALQSWKDKSAANSVQTALEQERARSQQQLQSDNLQKWVDYFGQFSEEERVELFARDPKIAAKFAEVQNVVAQQSQSISSDQVATTAQVYAYAHQISVYNKMLADSGLPEDKLQALKPDNFTHLGAAGVNAWGQAIFAALLEHQTSQKLEAELKTRWEAYKQEHLAELEPGYVPESSSGGGPTGPKKDLMTTDSNVLLEDALVRRGGK